MALEPRVLVAGDHRTVVLPAGFQGTGCIDCIALGAVNIAECSNLAELVLYLMFALVDHRNTFDSYLRMLVHTSHDPGKLAAAFEP